MSPVLPKFSQWYGLVLLLLMGSLWGLQFAMLKLATETGLAEIDALMIALVLLSAVFSLIVIARGETFLPNFKTLMFLVWIALLGYVIPLVVALYAIQHIPAGIITLIATLSPIVTISVAILFRLEPVSSHRIVAVVFGVIAVLFVLWPELELPEFGNANWLLVTLLIPLCYGVESIWIALYWPRGLTSLQVVTGETIIAALLVAPVFLFFGNPIYLVPSWPGGEFAIVIFVLAGVIESFIFFYLIEKTGGVFVSFGNFVSMLAGIAWGMIMFSETHGVFVWFAVAAAIISLSLATKNTPVSARSK